MAKILINQYPVFVKVGCFEHEQLAGQEILIDLIIEMGALSANDDLTQTLNYGEVLNYIDKQLKHQSFMLIERMVVVLGQGLLDHFEKINHLKLKITKPKIPFGLAKGCLIAVEEDFIRLKE